MIIWHMANMPAGVSTVCSIFHFVWMILMHSRWSTIGKSLSLIAIEDCFPLLTRLEVTNGHF
jgi:hypothetical protein